MSIIISETLSPKSRVAWREWLSKNHDKKTEVFVLFYKKQTGKQMLSYRDAVDEALCFGWIDGKEKGINDEQYMLRFTPRSAKSRWAERNAARYKMLEIEGLVTQSGRDAFNKKSFVYSSLGNKKGAIAWHLSHKMSKNPTLDQRIEWHKEHKKFCGCRPVPKSLKKLLKKDQ